MTETGSALAGQVRVCLPLLLSLERRGLGDCSSGEWVRSVGAEVVHVPRYKTLQGA